MASAPERLRLKDRIVGNVAKSVKSIQEYQVTCGCGDDPITLTNNDRPCQRLTENFDHVFLHGLRHIHYGYWRVVKEFTRKDAVREISRLRNITTDLGRGRAWLMMTLNECVLESYIRCYLDNKKLVKKYYVREAFVLDDQRMNVLLTLTAGLEYAIFQLDYDVPYLDLGTYPPGSRSRTSSTNSTGRDDDQLSLCSMDSFTTARVQNTTAVVAVEVTPDGSDTHSQNSFETNSSKPSSVDSGILVNGRNTQSVNHKDKSSGFPRGHDRELSLEEQDEELQVIRVTSSHRSKKKKVKKSQNGTKGHSKKEETLRKENQRSVPDEVVQQNSWLSLEPNLSDILDFNSTDFSNLPDRSPGDGIESSQESLYPDLVQRGNERSKVMENYNIAFVDMSKEDPDFNIYKHSAVQNSQSGYFNVYKGSQNSHGPIEQEALDLASKCNISEKKSSVIPLVEDSGIKNKRSSPENLKGLSDLSKEQDSLKKEDEDGELSDMYSCDIDQNCDTSSSLNTHSTVELTKHSDQTLKEKCSDEKENFSDGISSSCDIPDCRGNSAIDSFSSNHKSATSEMQDRVNDMINQSNTHLHRHMFEEEPEDIDEINGNVKDDEEILAGEVRLENNTILHLMLDVFEDSEEQFVKAFSTRTGHTEGDVKNVLLLITNRSLHLISQTQSDHRFVKESSVTYQQLDYISLGLSDQVIQIVCRNRRKQYWVTTGNQLVTRAIVSCLSQTVDKCEFDVPKVSVLTDATTQKIALKKYAARESRCEVSDVSISCYSLVHWDDPKAKGNNSDSTHREGHLLFKINEAGSSLGSTLLNTVQDPSSLLSRASWKPAYVVLRDGMLCIYGNKVDSKPMHFVQLGGDDCNGCRRASNSDRDHCIQVIMSNGTTWHIGLATDVEANEWLQSLCQAVAQGIQKSSKTVDCLPCCLVLTPQKLLMCHEDVQTSFFRTLGSANVVDITGVLVDSTVNSYCILEFESQDRGVSTDQWVLYFNGSSETDRFLQALSLAWSTYFQVGVPQTPISSVSLQKSCRDMAAQLKSSLEVRQ